MTSSSGACGHTGAPSAATALGWRGGPQRGSRAAVARRAEDWTSGARHQRQLAPGGGPGAIAKKLTDTLERERLWRLRKRQQSIDAILRDEVTLEFVMNGKRVTARRWGTRAQAVKAATEKRTELERARVP